MKNQSKPSSARRKFFALSIAIAAASLASSAFATNYTWNVPGYPDFQAAQLKYNNANTTKIWTAFGATTAANFEKIIQVITEDSSLSGTVNGINTYGGGLGNSGSAAADISYLLNNINGTQGGTAPTNLDTKTNATDLALGFYAGSAASTSGSAILAANAGSVVAAAESFAPGTGTTPVNGAIYLTSQMILAAKTGTPAAEVPANVQAIALGAAGNSTVIGFVGGKDVFATQLSAQLNTAANLPYLNSAMYALINNGGYSDTEIAGDVYSVGGAIAESATFEALLAKQYSSDAASIGYAAATASYIANQPATTTGTTTRDTAITTLADDIAKNVTGSAAALSGSLGQLLVKTADKLTFAQGLVHIDNTDYQAILLGVANSLPQTDGTDLATLVEDSYAATGDAALKTNTAIPGIINNIASSYTGNLVGGTPSTSGLPALTIATVAGKVNTLIGASVTGLGGNLITTLLPTALTNAGQSAGNAATVASLFASNVKSTTAATEYSLASTIQTQADYANTLTPVQTGDIAAAIASSVPSATTNLALLTGTLGVNAANAATAPGGGDLADSLSLVAGELATFATTSGSAVKVGNYIGAATVLAAAAAATPDGGVTAAAIPAIAAAFTSQPAMYALGASATTGIGGLVNALVKAYPLQAADILGYVLASGVPPTLQGTTTGSLFADVYTTLTTTASCESAIEGSSEFIAAESSLAGTTTLAKLENWLKTGGGTASSHTVGQLNNAFTDSTNTADFPLATDSGVYFGQINPDETPILPL